MPVFKMYFKLIKTKYKMILAYTISFLVVFSLFTNYYKSTMSNETGFQPVKVSVAIHDHDNSTLSKALIAYIDETQNLKEVKESEEAIKDALFYEQIAYYVEIPEHFEQDFLAGKTELLQTMEKPDRAMGFQVKNRMDTYLHDIKVYYEVNPTGSMEDITAKVQHALSQTVTTNMINSQDIDGASLGRGMFFQFLSFIFVTLYIMIGGLILLRVFDQEMRKRTMISPISQTSFNLQLLAAGFLSATACWGVFMVALQIIIGGLFEVSGLYCMFNSFLYMILCMALTFLIANILAGRKHVDEALSGIGTFIGLGMSFLGGVFVPQNLMGEGVHLIGSFLPSFWYVKANNALSIVKSFDFESMKDIYFSFLVEVLFIIVFVVLAVYIGKTKRSANEI